MTGGLMFPLIKVNHNYFLFSYYLVIYIFTYTLITRCLVSAYHVLSTPQMPTGHCYDCWQWGGLWKLPLAQNMIFCLTPSPWSPGSSGLFYPRFIIRFQGCSSSWMSTVGEGIQIETVSKDCETRSRGRLSSWASLVGHFSSHPLSFI